MKLFQSVDSLYDLIYSGVLERFPKLKIVLVENELGWIPSDLGAVGLLLQTPWRQARGLAITKPPSEYFHEQICDDFLQRTLSAGQYLVVVGTRTTACGPTISRTATRPGPILVALLPAT